MGAAASGFTAIFSPLSSVSGHRYCEGLSSPSKAHDDAGKSKFELRDREERESEQAAVNRGFAQAAKRFDNL
ncbi:MAG: hypothetical protein C5B44_03425 [Acidobacteria bacterium]|nr:MAG: hypothetical protein C5B44_03425 [Acidobacteriota bacterium]